MSAAQKCQKSALNFKGRFFYKILYTNIFRDYILKYNILEIYSYNFRPKLLVFMEIWRFKVSVARKY